MTKGETHLATLIGSMQPILNAGSYVFCVIDSPKTIEIAEIIGFFKEKEGVTVIVEKTVAIEKGLNYSSEFAWISLTIHSALEAVGLTAAFSKALANANISCNVVAGYYHDHIFVPLKDAQKAIETLERLAKNNDGI